MFIKKAFALMSILFVLVACDGKSEKKIQETKKSRYTQKVNDSLYKNDYFGFTVELPKGWYSQSYAETEALADQGGDVLAGDDETLKAQLKAAKKQTYNLFGFFEHPVGSPVPFNPNCLAIAESVSMAPGVKTGKDYFFHLKKVLNGGQVKYTFVPGYKTIQISGRKFDVLEGSITMNGILIKQKYNVRIQDGFAFGLIQTYSTDEGMMKTGKVLQTLKFN